MEILSLRVLIFWVLMMIATPMWAAGEITTGSLISEMADLSRLTTFPEPAYRTVQYSSYDRRSLIPGAPGWFANSDGFGGEPQANFEAILKPPNEEGIGEYLICDLEGPGAWVRSWTAIIEGELRVFLDDHAEPLYEGPAEPFLRRPFAPFLAGSELTEEVFEGSFVQRDAAYFPIPFQRHFRMVWIGDLEKVHFYQVQFRLYEPGTKIRSFAPQDVSDYRREIASTVEKLRDPDRFLRPEGKETTFRSIAGDAEQVKLFSYEGAGEITRFQVRLEPETSPEILRQTLLLIRFDDHPWPQVQAPIGDFFGAAPGVNPYISLPFSVSRDGKMTCRFVMPFRESVEILLENRSGRKISVAGGVTMRHRAWDEHRSLHFRALWRVDHDLTASHEQVQDLPFLIAEGSGVYVGSTSFLLNPNPVPHSYGNWWGEGDEKVFVDHGREPSIFGTGSEDYYNYSWSSNDIFLYPYCGQPRNDGPANRGFVANYRWHILDDIPFRERIGFYMELYSHEKTPGVSYARVAYHYARQGIRDDHIPITREDQRLLELPENWEPAARMGARDSFFVAAEAILTPQENMHWIRDPLWEGGTLVVWEPGESGEEMTLPLSIESPGTYRIRVVLRSSPESGRLSAHLNGTPLEFSEPIDLSTDFRILSRAHAAEPVLLSHSENVLTLRSEGAGGNGGTEIGVDFLWLQRVE